MLLASIPIHVARIPKFVNCSADGYELKLVEVASLLFIF